MAILHSRLAAVLIHGIGIAEEPYALARHPRPMTSHPATLIDRPDHPAERRTAERRSAVVRLFLGDRADAAWLRPAFWALLLLTAVLYLWDITVSGSANSFYAAAVQAGSESWKSWFFGSLDTADFITVDKPPASLWVMGLSARIFGFSSASMLVPEALMAVASVALTWGWSVGPSRDSVARRRTSARCSPGSSWR